jgi:aryl-alcohol dehydrogenase-like predicted oxidoreductase
MKYTRLGKTDITVSVVAMGCWALGGGRVWGHQDDAISIATVRAALDSGVSFFDTAEGYEDGYSEEVLGQALAGRREEAVIATKVSRVNLSGTTVQLACEDSLRRLKTDYIDLYQIHWPNRSTPLAETVEALERLREQGKIRAIGVSNFGVQDLSDMLAIGRPESDQVPYSLLWRAIEYGIKQKCVEEEVGVLCYSPLAQGLLTGKFASPDEVPTGRARTRHFSTDRPQVSHGEQGCEAEAFAAIKTIHHISQRLNEPMAKVAVAWLLHQPGVTSVIAGARQPDQIEQNIQAVDLELSSEIIDELNQATDEVKRKLGPNPDMWQSESRYQ